MLNLVKEVAKSRKKSRKSQKVAKVAARNEINCFISRFFYWEKNLFVKKLNVAGAKCRAKVESTTSAHDFFLHLALIASTNRNKGWVQFSIWNHNAIGACNTWLIPPFVFASHYARTEFLHQPKQTFSTILKLNFINWYLIFRDLLFCIPKESEALLHSIAILKLFKVIQVLFFSSSQRSNPQFLLWFYWPIYTT